MWYSLKIYKSILKKMGDERLGTGDEKMEIMK